MSACAESDHRPARTQPGRLVSQLWELARITAALASRGAGLAPAGKASGLAELPVLGLRGRQPVRACSRAGGCRRASRTISTRDRAPSLARMWEMWVCTVLRDSHSSAAMSGLDCPAATRYATLVSVGVRACHPAAW